MTDFDKLKWIINNNAQPNAEKLKAKMLEALGDGEIAKQIEWLKKNDELPEDFTVQTLKENFLEKFTDPNDPLVEFVADVAKVEP